MSSDQTSAEPLPIAALELLQCSCLMCKAEVWHYPGGKVSDGRAFTFDREPYRDTELLSLHGCHYQPGPDDLYDPDWGWVEG